MHVDIHVPRFTWPGGPEAIGPTFASLAQTAEAIGVRTLSVMDHWFQMDQLWPAEEPMLEGYTTLSFAAAKTERLRFRLLVGGVTYRHPGLLAKTVTTLDVLSGGRAELGLGAAWYEREHRGLGVPFPPLKERYERLEETLQICFQMWSDDNGPYEGRHFQLAETLCSPPPVSTPRPRVLIGGGGERKTLRIVATYADACNFIGNAATVAHKVDVLRGHCEAVGRDPADIEVTALIMIAEDAGPGCHHAGGGGACRSRHGRHRRPLDGTGAVAMARGDVGPRDTEAGRHRLGRAVPRPLSCSPGPLAHPEEQGTFNPKVPGSRPGRPTTKVQSQRTLTGHDLRVAMSSMGARRGEYARCDGPTSTSARGQCAAPGPSPVPTLTGHSTIFRYRPGGGHHA